MRLEPEIINSLVSIQAINSICILGEFSFFFPKLNLFPFPNRDWIES